MWNYSNFNWNNMYFRDAVVPVFHAFIAAAAAAAHTHTRTHAAISAAHAAHVARVAALVNPCGCYSASITKYGPHSVQIIPCRQQ
jgi:hypothetical protein